MEGFNEINLFKNFDSIYGLDSLKKKERKKNMQLNLN